MYFQEKNIVLGVNKITFQKEEIKITEPKGKVMTQKEFSDKLKNYYENEKD